MLVSYILPVLRETPFKLRPLQSNEVYLGGEASVFCNGVSVSGFTLIMIVQLYGHNMDCAHDDSCKEPRKSMRQAFVLVWNVDTWCLALWSLLPI